jgi:hypothetical protein
MLEVHAIPSSPENTSELARVSITGPAYYLLRPDGYVGLAGTIIDQAALRRWFVNAGVAVEQPVSGRELGV